MFFGDRLTEFLFEGLDLVAELCGAFELELFGGGEHFGFEFAEEFVVDEALFGGVSGGFAFDFSGLDFFFDAATDGFADGFGCDAVDLVIFDLECSSAEGFVDGALHAFGDGICIEDNAGIDISGGAADGLDEAGFAAEEAFFVSVHDGNERDFGQVKSFAEEVDTDDGIKESFAEFSENFDSFDGIEFGVQPLAADAFFLHPCGEVFGESFCEGGDEGAFACCGAKFDLFEEVRDLAASGFDDDFGVDEPGGADDLFDDFTGGLIEFPVCGCCRDEDSPCWSGVPFVEGEWSVVFGHGETEAVIDECGFSGVISGVHGADLGDGDVGFVDEHEEVIGEEVVESVRRFSGFSSGESAAVVFDAWAEAGFFHEFEVMSGASGESLCFEKFALLLEVFERFVEFGADFFEGVIDATLGEYEVFGGVDVDFAEGLGFASGDGVDHGEFFDFVSPEFDAI